MLFTFALDFLGTTSSLTPDKVVVLAGKPWKIVLFVSKKQEILCKEFPGCLERLRVSMS